MATIDVRRFGLACGSTAALLYLGCVFVMATVSRDAQVLFFNSLLHGIDSDALLRTTMPASEMVLGIIEIFILAWLSGASIASIYNVAARRG